jgi:3-oxoacyl-[acyl-carrier protein] reductase
MDREMDLGLKQKVAMVGGGSRGLGYGVARALASHGAVLSIASRSRDAIERAGKQLKQDGAGDVLPVAADLADRDSIAEWHKATLERFGGVDLLFTNTGGPPAGPVLNFDDAAWSSGFELLVLSAIRLVRLVVPSMQSRGGGAILMSTSSSVKEPIANLALSNVLRASVAALAKTLSIELAGQKIRVNQLIPGRIDTDRVRQLDDLSAKRLSISVDEQQKRASAAIPLGRYGTIDEFGRMGAFLLSDAASYITGASVQVDGGLIRGVV